MLRFISGVLINLKLTLFKLASNQTIISDINQTLDHYWRSSKRQTIAMVKQYVLQRPSVTTGKTPGRPPKIHIFFFLRNGLDV